MTDAAPPALRVVSDAEELARSAAVEIRRFSQRAIEERGIFRLVLAGGSTPRRLYELLASQAFRSRLEWRSFEVFFGDERDVPPDHPESNFRMARETLLEPAGIPDVRVHRMRSASADTDADPASGAATSIGASHDSCTAQGRAASDAASLPAGESPPAGGDRLETAARRYEVVIARAFALPSPGEEWDDGPAGTRRPGALPRFDLVLLGLGEDGHTASLFPGTDALDATDRWVVPVRLGGGRHDRLTMTAPLINAARAVLFLVSGPAKRRALRALLSGTGDPRETPARLVRPSAGRLLVLADDDAAGGLGARL